MPIQEPTILHTMESKQKSQAYAIVSFAAAQKGHTKLLSTLHHHYPINVHISDANQNTALLYSAEQAHVEAANYLLQQDAYIVTSVDLPR